ncbi:MAG TPA: hypothetical protein VLH75_08535 [Longimicrobiales bacterium]|nr:hypothetical protein [Longimicrobiales bacterium]
MVALPLLGLSAGCDAILGPAQPDSDWRSHESAHFSLFVRPGSFCEANRVRLAEVLDDQYATTLDRLGITYSGRISAFLHASTADAALGFEYGGLGYPATEALRATCLAPLGGQLFSLLSHEANHVIQWNAMGRPGTYFMSEGLASAVMSTRFHGLGKESFWEWTTSHASAIPPLSTLIDDAKWGGSDLEYRASVSFVAYLIERAGPAPIRQLFQVKSAQFPARLEVLYGRSLEDLERDWRAFCAARPRI